MVSSLQAIPELQTAGKHAAKTGQGNERIRTQVMLEVVKCSPGLPAVSAWCVRKGTDGGDRGVEDDTESSS